jgi:hypothetical protein
MVSLSFFLGKIIPLTNLLKLISQFGLIMLVLVIAWIIVPIFWELRHKKFLEKQ